MSIHYLLDGYNIIHSAAMHKHLLTARKCFSAQQRRNDERSEEFSCQMPALNPAKLEDQRYELIRFIERYTPQGSLKNGVTIVFDGDVNVFGGMQSNAAKVVFSQGESADDKIRKIVSQAKNTKNLVVVTDDRDIQYAVGALGAKISSVDKFLKKGSPEKEKNTTGKDFKQTKKHSPISEKYISKSSEFAITSELSKIWLKDKKK